MLSITAYELPFSVPGSADDRRALHFYFTRNQSYHELGCAAKFWCTLVPQRCQHEQVLRITLVAFSKALLHQNSLEAHGPKGSSNTLYGALQAHGRAVQSLQRFIKRPQMPEPVVILTCCILLVSVSQLLELQDEAAVHLDHGITLFNSWHRQTPDVMPSAEHRMLHTMLGVMDALASQRVSFFTPKVISGASSQTEPRPRDQNELSHPPKSVLDPVQRQQECSSGLTPDTIDNIEEMYADGLLTSYLPINQFVARNTVSRPHTLSDVSQRLLEEQRTLMHSAAHWDRRCQAFERKYYDSLVSSDSSKLIAHIRLLTAQLHNIIAETKLAESIPTCAPTPLFWDQAAPRIFEIARKYRVSKDQLFMINEAGMNFDQWKPNSVRMQRIKLCMDTLARHVMIPETRATALELKRIIVTWRPPGCQQNGG